MTTASGSKQGTKQELAIAALLTAPTYAEAAKAIGMSEQTIWRWMQEEDFRNAFIAAKKRVLDQAISQLQSATSEAVKTLKELLYEEKYPNIRLQAAKSVLELAFRGYEVEEQDARIAEIEKRIKEKKN